MGIIGKLVHDSLVSVDKVVEKEVKRLEKEAAKLGVESMAHVLQSSDEEVTASEIFGDGLKSLFTRGRARTDRVLLADIRHQGYEISMALPFSGKESLAAEFRVELPGSLPLPFALERSLVGSWGEGSWVTREDADETTVESCMAAFKVRDEIREGMEWDVELAGDYVIKLEWAMQLVPQGETTVVHMQTGRVGVFSKTLGLKLLAKKLPQLEELLSLGLGATGEQHRPVHPTLLV